MEKIEVFLSITDGYGAGYGDGSGSGSGSGSGYGYGDGYGDGSGDGYGDGSGIPDKINNMQIHYVDNVPTIITHVVGNIAKGFVVNDDLTMTPCYIVKHGNYFAHGATKEKAIEDLNAKIFSNLDVEEKLKKFLDVFELDKKYKGHEFYRWHNLLTGSCEMGREQFIKSNNLSLDDDYTVNEFINICKNAYGSGIIKQLENKIKSKEKGEN